jgi:hypothetical protein
MANGQPPPEFFEWLFSGDGRAAVAGALGGLVRWITLREHWADGLASLLVGAVCAMYLGPLVSPMLNPVIGQFAPDSDGSGFSAFVVGLGGISFSGFLIDVIRARRRQTKRATRAKRGPDDSP